MTAAPENSGTSKRRARQFLVPAAFVGFLAGGALLDLAIWPLPPLRPGGQEAAEREAAARAAKFADGSRFRLVDRESVLASRTRTALLPVWAALRLGLFREASDRVVVADDGWLFLKERLVRGEGPRREVAARPAATLSAVARRLEAAGLRVLLVPIPTKATMVRSVLPPDSQVDPEAYPALMEALAERGIESIDVLDVWSRPPAFQPYCRTDTHWSHEGALRVAEEIARRLRVLAPGRHGEDLARASVEDALHMLTYLGMGGAGPRADARWVLRLTGFTRPLPLPVLPPAPDGGDWAAGDAAEILLVGTSFSAWPGFASYLGYFSDGRIAASSFDGGGPFGALGLEILRVREGRRATVPHTLVWEIPSFSLVVPRWLHWSEHIWRLLPVNGYAPFGLQPRWTGSLEPGEIEIAAPVSAHIPAGSIFHSGGGEVSVRFRGRPLRGALRVTVWSGSEGSRGLWVPGDGDLVMPVAGTDFASRQISVHIEPHEGGSARLQFDSATLESDLALVGAAASMAEGRGAVSPPSGPAIANRSALYVELPDGSPAGAALRIETTAGHVHLPLKETARPGAVAILAFGPGQRGARLLAVRWTDDASRRLRAAFVPGPRQ